MKKDRRRLSEWFAMSCTQNSIWNFHCNVDARVVSLFIYGFNVRSGIERMENERNKMRERKSSLKMSTLNANKSLREFYGTIGMK